MANCNLLFSEFNQTIRLTKERRNNLKERRSDLRARIRGGYDIVRTSEELDHNLEIHSQGSFVMDTIINPSRQDDSYDLDDGVYFIGSLSRQNRPEPETFHRWIYKSIEAGKSTNDYEKIIDKNTCIRVLYKGNNGDFNYHIDIPIYYNVVATEPDLADKKEWWHISNPIEFIIWFENLTNSGFMREYILEQKNYYEDYSRWLENLIKKDHQLRRIVRYLKSWGDFKKEDMPPGVVMTILAGYNYVPNERDDISLKETLGAIKVFLSQNGFKCPRPTSPVGEDLFKNYSTTRKEYFKNALNSFVESATKAIQNPNQKESCMEWKRHLGNRFPCIRAKDEKDYSALSSVAAKSDMWSE
ncbi:MAG: hypothetical protein V2B15_21350 [Bacteroidota bacterium]